MYFIPFWRQNKCTAVYCGIQACPIFSEKAIISPAAGLRAKSIISPGRTDTEFYYQSGR